MDNWFKDLKQFLKQNYEAESSVKNFVPLHAHGKVKGKEKLEIQSLWKISSSWPIIVLEFCSLSIIIPIPAVVILKKY